MSSKEYGNVCQIPKVHRNQVPVPNLFDEPKSNQMKLVFKISDIACTSYKSAPRSIFNIL